MKLHRQLPGGGGFQASSPDFDKLLDHCHGYTDVEKLSLAVDLLRMVEFPYAVTDDKRQTNAACSIFAIECMANRH